jgi:hypothetical protein
MEKFYNYCMLPQRALVFPSLEFLGTGSALPNSEQIRPPAGIALTSLPDFR